MYLPVGTFRNKLFYVTGPRSLKFLCNPVMRQTAALVTQTFNMPARGCSVDFALTKTNASILHQLT